jgi:hypothetical protein
MIAGTETDFSKTPTIGSGRSVRHKYLRLTFHLGTWLPPTSIVKLRRCEERETEDTAVRHRVYVSKIIYIYISPRKSPIGNL